MAKRDDKDGGKRAVALSRRGFIGGSGALAVVSATGGRAVAGENTPQANTGGAPGWTPSEQCRAFMDQFGLTCPIVQAPPGGERLAAAVASAGGLGALGIGWMSPDEAFEAVTRTVAATGGRVYGNFVLHFEPGSLDRALEAGCPTIQFSWGLPSPQAVAKIRGAGARLGIQVTSRDNARRALDLEPDFLICQGLEAGGHVQATASVEQAFPEVLEQAGDVPVLLAGGVATGQDIRAALDRGAAGVIMGTRLIATREADIHEDYKQRLVAADEHSTVYTHCFNQDWDAMHRVLRNDTFLGWEAAGCPTAGSKPGEGDIVANHPQLGPVVRYNTMPPLAGHVGQVGDMALYAGTGVARIGDVPPAAELVQRLWREAQGAAPV